MLKGMTRASRECRDDSKEKKTSQQDGLGVNELAAESEVLSLIPGSLMMEGENSPSSVRSSVCLYVCLSPHQTVSNKR